MQPMGHSNESYNNLTIKILLAFKQIYNEEPNFDYYGKFDDDTYVNMDNLRLFLQDKDPKLPVTYGYDFKTIVNSYVRVRISFYKLSALIETRNTLKTTNRIGRRRVEQKRKKIVFFPLIILALAYSHYFHFPKYVFYFDKVNLHPVEKSKTNF
jgi:hypothetical protein